MILALGLLRIIPFILVAHLSWTKGFKYLPLSSQMIGIDQPVYLIIAKRTYQCSWSHTL